MLAPKEHGFWVMLGAALGTALARHATTPSAWLVAAVTAALAVVLGGRLGRRVRRSGGLQVASALALAWFGLPVELACGGAIVEAACIALVWTAIFVSGALAVRAAFARSAHKGARCAVLSAASVLTPLVIYALLRALPGGLGEAPVAALAAATALVMSLSFPTVKQLRPLGLALAAVSTVAAVLLVL